MLKQGGPPQSSPGRARNTKVASSLQQLKFKSGPGGDPSPGHPAPVDDRPQKSAPPYGGIFHKNVKGIIFIHHPPPLSAASLHSLLSDT
ncbi:hypothetical protein INR49_018464 [Caranx melampygus]|nr:hypothetical protein INR49_018464 [Caranx melampygus]